MHHTHVMHNLEIMNNIRAIFTVNKEDMECIATKLNLDSSIQLNILWIVYCHEGVRITTIAEWTFWHTSSIVIHVKKLMEKELVMIEKSDLDGRVVNVYLTDLGRELILRMYELLPSHSQFTKAIEAMRNRYSPAVIELFKELLDFLAVELHGQEKLDWIKENEQKLSDLKNKALMSNSV